MNTSKIVVVALVWLLLLAAGVTIWKLWIQPRKQQTTAAQQAENEKKAIEATSGTSRYQSEVSIGLDSFSGYAILRSEEFRKQLAADGVRLKIVDDQADYTKRLDGLAKNTLQLAAFPIDALIKSSSAAGTLPATIVAIIDETRGADAMVAYKAKFPTIDALNAPDTRLVLVGGSPSETLAQILRQDFDLSLLPRGNVDRVASPDEVVARYRKSNPGVAEAYVVWEPYVSQILENGQMHAIVDSAKFSGYIVDSLVVNRQFLLSSPRVVEEVLQAYFGALNFYRKASDLKDVGSLTALITDDAKRNGLTLTSQQSTRLIQGIEWKYTEDNYRYFGLSGSDLHLDDVVDKIMRLLKTQGGLVRDPADGQMERWYHDKTLAKLRDDQFLPNASGEAVRQWKPLTDTEWSSMVPIGKLKIDELVFARGTDRLTEQSRATLTELAEKLTHSWPNVYIQIQGSAAAQGDPEQNKLLAAKRAQASLEYLQGLGVQPLRMRASEAKVAGEAKVTFHIGQLPY